MIEGDRRRAMECRMEELVNQSCQIHVIMASDDTYSKTRKLLEDNKYFGMFTDQVHLLKQIDGRKWFLFKIWLAFQGSQMILNVEYNQLDPLLRASGHPDGDFNDPTTGYSPYPGNINQLVIKIGPYIEELSRTKGAVVEFVNSKYKDASRTTFTSPTRQECMMQDYPKTLSPSAKVMSEGNSKHSPTFGEMAINKAYCLILRKVVSNTFPFFAVLYLHRKLLLGKLLNTVDPSSRCLDRPTNHNG